MTSLPARLGDVPVVYMSYDEPWAERGFEALRRVRPDALRVHGVKGLDACHKAAAEAAGSDWFLTVDADTELSPSVNDVALPPEFLTPVFRLDWPSRNAVNGIVTGNGCLKLWPRRLAMDMRSHEAAPAGRISLDADIGTVVPGRSRQVPMPGCYSTTNPARTPYHGFRAGFREAVFLAHMAGKLARGGAGNAGRIRVIHRALTVWTTLGRHANNGLWVIYGARLGYLMAATWTNWDPRMVNDYTRFKWFWETQVVPRIGPGGSRCGLTGLTWDHDRLSSESAALGVRIADLTGLVFADLPASLSRVVAEARILPAERAAPLLDALGRAFDKGDGVAAAPETARNLYETAAILGQTSALTNLGRLHDLDRIGGASRDEAERLFRQATELGNPHAPWHLGNLLKTSGASDEAEALLDLAAERGFAPAPPRARDGAA